MLEFPAFVLSVYALATRGETQTAFRKGWIAVLDTHGPISGYQQSASISIGYVTNASTSGSMTIGGLLAPNTRGSHNKAV